jgi:hypothetical protein
LRRYLGDDNIAPEVTSLIQSEEDHKGESKAEFQSGKEVNMPNAPIDWLVDQTQTKITSIFPPPAAETNGVDTTWSTTKGVARNVNVDHDKTITSARNNESTNNVTSSVLTSLQEVGTSEGAKKVPLLSELRLPATVLPEYGGKEPKSSLTIRLYVMS